MSWQHRPKYTVLAAGAREGRVSSSESTLYHIHGQMSTPIYPSSLHYRHQSVCDYEHGKVHVPKFHKPKLSLVKIFIKMVDKLVDNKLVKIFF